MEDLKPNPRLDLSEPLWHHATEAARCTHRRLVLVCLFLVIGSDVLLLQLAERAGLGGEEPTVATALTASVQSFRTFLPRAALPVLEPRSPLHARNDASPRKKVLAASLEEKFFAPEPWEENPGKSLQDLRRPDKIEPVRWHSTEEALGTHRGTMGRLAATLGRLGNAVVRLATLGKLGKKATTSLAMREGWKAGPAEVNSDRGKVALALLEDHPELFDTLVDKELEVLQARREERAGLEEITGESYILRQKIDRIRDAEEKRLVMELLYLKVCSKIRRLRVPMLPSMKDGGDFAFGRINMKGLTEDLWTVDALELVKEQLFRVLRQQMAGRSSSYVGSNAVMRMALFQAGQVYAMSALLGYSLRNYDARFQAEKFASMVGKTGELETDSDSDSSTFEPQTMKSLEEYISSFGPKEAKRMTSIASMEARMAMEFHVAAAFGDLKALQRKLKHAVGTVNSMDEATAKLQRAIEDQRVESLCISSNDLSRLVLEAVAYGALLRDSENEVNSVYQLTPFGGDDDGGVSPVKPKLPTPIQPRSSSRALTR